MKRFLPLLFSIFFVFLIFFYLSFRVFEFFKPYLPYTNYLLGVGKPIHYLILLGNDTEMRANGGFTGSYAKIALDNFPTSHKIDLDFQDIYVPNGQLAGHVTAPQPIQDAFGHGTWELANADWEPDFPTAASAIRWFLDKGGETNPDILAIVNLSTIKNILDVVGPFAVPEYSATITPDNLYLFLQGKSEVGFFPGSTQKKDTLLNVGKSLVRNIEHLPLFKKIKIAQIIYSNMVNQNILVNSTNHDFQDFINKKNFSGILKPAAFDTYSLVETNLGANKANAYITRQTTHVVIARSASDAAIYRNNSINHQVTVTFHNTSPEANPNPPFHYGGNYLAYLRFYIPTIAQNISLETATSSAVIASLVPEPKQSPPNEGSIACNIKCARSSKYGFTEIGFWHITAAGTTSTANLSYDLPLSDPKDYSLAILKQHGLITSPQTINLFGKEYTSNLNSSLYLH